MLIKWDEFNSVNVKEIDGQHKILVSVINRLDDARVRNDLEDIKNLFTELLDYADFHFATEEKYFAKFKYPATESHEAEHAVYREKIGAFNERYKTEGAEVIPEILAFLRDWWIMHINTSDANYTDFFNENGLY
ncbi:MAG: bacteriohemerythrin [Candidatus Falkowbacteria bacterium]